MTSNELSALIIMPVKKRPNACIIEGCDGRAIYNIAAIDNSGLFCNEHKWNGMTKKDLRICKYGDCQIYASFNFSNKMGVAYCSAHKLDGMVNKKVITDNNDFGKKLCEWQNCTMYAAYNFSEENTPIYCAAHKIIGMVHKRPSRACRHDNCNTQPSYNYPGERGRIYCKKHSLPGMVTKNYFIGQQRLQTKKEDDDYETVNELSDYESNSDETYELSESESDDEITYSEKTTTPNTSIMRTCIITQCDMQAHYNIENETIPAYCNEHKTATMVIKDNTICNADSCLNIVLPRDFSVGILYCDKHKKKDEKTCIEPGCINYSIYDFPKYFGHRYCADHKKNGMVVKKQGTYCVIQGCNIHASYNYPNSIGYRYCAVHKKNGMIAKSSGARCLEVSCNRRAYYNYENFPGVKYCSKHKKPSMIIKKYTKKCRHEGCNKWAYYSFVKANNVRYCFQHKTAGMTSCKKRRAAALKRKRA